jgi:hypothetical protein
MCSPKRLKVTKTGDVKDEKKESKGQFSEESLDKARGILNEMIETAQEELDDKIIECKVRGRY